MRRAIYLLLVLLICYACASKGELSTFSLRKEFTIDTENDRIAETGLTDMGLNFDVDSDGNIFLAGYENTGGMIFKFDREGNFVRSFCRKGQGSFRAAITCRCISPPTETTTSPSLTLGTNWRFSTGTAK